MPSIQKFLKAINDWLTDKTGHEQVKKLKETLPAPPPRPQIRTIEDVRAVTEIKTFRDVKAFCEEVRKTLTIYKKSSEQMRDASWTHKKATDSLYVEMGNLAGKIESLIESQKGEDDV